MIRIVDIYLISFKKLILWLEHLNVQNVNGLRHLGKSSVLIVGRPLPSNAQNAVTLGAGIMGINIVLSVEQRLENRESDYSYFKLVRFD